MYLEIVKNEAESLRPKRFKGHRGGGGEMVDFLATRDSREKAEQYSSSPRVRYAGIKYSFGLGLRWFSHLYPARSDWELWVGILAVGQFLMPYRTLVLSSNVLVYLIGFWFYLLPYSFVLFYILYFSRVSSLVGDENHPLCLF